MSYVFRIYANDESPLEFGSFHQAMEWLVDKVKEYDKKWVCWYEPTPKQIVAVSVSGGAVTYDIRRVERV